MTVSYSDPEVSRTRPGVVERLTQILDVFMQGQEFLMLEDITRATGLPRSTAFRLLTQLRELQWIEHGPAGYSLGPRSRHIGERTQNITDHGTIRNAAAVILNELHGATQAVAHLGVLEGSSIHYLDKIGGAATNSVPSRVGGRMRADRTVCGKALLAFLPPEKVDSLFSVVLTDSKSEPPDLPRLHQQLNQIRGHHGVAIDSADRCVMGIGAVAAPIIGPDGPVGAISLAGRDPRTMAKAAPMVAFAARRTAHLLFKDRRSTDVGTGLLNRVRV